jgi:hypothetical protein
LALVTAIIEGIAMLIVTLALELASYQRRTTDGDIEILMYCAGCKALAIGAED